MAHQSNVKDVVHGTYRNRIIKTVLNAALAEKHDATISACRRLLMANIRGWRRHHQPKDWAFVQEMFIHLTVRI